MRENYCEWNDPDLGGALELVVFFEERFRLRLTLANAAPTREVRLALLHHPRDRLQHNDVIQ